MHILDYIFSSLFYDKVLKLMHFSMLDIPKHSHNTRVLKSFGLM